MAQAIFFDLYGTLLIYGDMHAAWKRWREAFHDSLWEIGLDMPGDEFAQSCEGFFSQPAPPASDDGLSIFERRIARHCADLGVNPTRLDIARAAEATVSAWDADVRLDPQAIPVLRELAADYRLALVSNYDHPTHAQRRLDITGLAERFEVTVISGTVGVAKPDPRIFGFAFEPMGLTADDVIFVGDSREDMQASCAADIRPVLIRRDAESGSNVPLDFRLDRDPEDDLGDVCPDGVTVISSLGELPGVLEEAAHV